MATTDTTDHVWDLLKSMDVCMLVTRAAGQMRSRPMSSIPVKEDGRIYFLADRDARVDDEIVGSSAVLLAYANGSSTFLSVTGHGQVSDDRALIKRLWNGGAQAFWPEGADKASVRVLVVAPTDAELWEGPNSMVAAARMVLAVATSTKPDLGDKTNVAMGSR